MISGLPQRALGREEFLDFITPLKIGPRGILGNDFSDVAFSIMDRAAALAIHKSVEVPRERSAWRDLAKAQTYDASKLVAVPPWQAWSANGGHKQRLGYVGPAENFLSHTRVGADLGVGGLSSCRSPCSRRLWPFSILIAIRLENCRGNQKLR